MQKLTLCEAATADAPSVEPRSFERQRVAFAKLVPLVTGLAQNAADSFAVHTGNGSLAISSHVVGWLPRRHFGVMLRHGVVAC